MQGQLARGDALLGEPLWVTKELDVIPVSKLEDWLLLNAISTTLIEPRDRPGWSDILIDELESGGRQGGTSQMGRKQINYENCTVRFPAGTMARINKLLEPTRISNAEFMRHAIITAIREHEFGKPFRLWPSTLLDVDDYEEVDQ